MQLQSDKTSHALRRGLELLSRRSWTEHDLRAAISTSFSRTETDNAINRINSLGYLNDMNWAEQYLSRRPARERATSLLRNHLLSHGISSEDADLALRDHDDHAVAERIALRRIGPLNRIESQRHRRRLRDYLARRGFDESVVESTLARIINQDREPTITSRHPQSPFTAN